MPCTRCPQAARTAASGQQEKGDLAVEKHFHTPVAALGIGDGATLNLEHAASVEDSRVSLDALVFEGCNSGFLSLNGCTSYAHKVRVDWMLQVRASGALAASPRHADVAG